MNAVDRTQGVVDDVIQERAKQRDNPNVDMESFDQGNTRNDWIAYINAYIGRAAQKVFRNDREQQDFRANMVKAAALCIAAIEAHDKGFC